jgi:ribosomal protein S8
MDGDFKIKDKLILELHDHCVVGELVKINESRTRLKLTNYYRFDNPGYVARGIQNFFKNDIKSIRVFQGTRLNRAELDDFVKTDKNDSPNIDDSSSAVNISLNTLNHITGLINEVQVVSQIDVRYYNSVKTLCQSKKLGITIEGVTHGRLSRISLIAISNNVNIFVYDIVLFGGIIPKELKEILESDKIVKLVHDSQGVADNLKNCHDVKLQKVFDTMIFHASICNTRAKIGITECTEKYFNLPSNVLLTSKDLNWYERPLTQAHKQVLGNNVAYLIELKRILKQILLKPYNDSLNKYMAGLRDDTNLYGDIIKVIMPNNLLESSNGIETTAVDFSHLDI